MAESRFYLLVMTAVEPIFLPIPRRVDVLPGGFLVQPIDSAVLLARLQKQLFPIAFAIIGQARSALVRSGDASMTKI